MGTIGKWSERITDNLSDAVDILGRTAIKVARLFGRTVDEDDIIEAVDKATDAIEAPLAALISARFPGLPPAIAKGAAKHALDYVDAAVAGMLAGKGK